jgi:hypothetical protein
MAPFRSQTALRYLYALTSDVEPRDGGIPCDGVPAISAKMLPMSPAVSVKVVVASVMQQADAERFGIEHDEPHGQRDRLRAFAMYDPT